MSTVFKNQESCNIGEMTEKKNKKQDPRAVGRGLLVKSLRSKSRKFKTQKKLADFCGCSDSYIHQIESGDIIDIGGPIQIKMAEALNLRPYELNLDPQPPALSQQSLQAILEGVEAGLEKNNRIMAPDKKSKLISALMVLWRESHSKQDISEATEQLSQFLDE